MRCENAFLAVNGKIAVNQRRRAYTLDTHTHLAFSLLCQDLVSRREPHFLQTRRAQPLLELEAGLLRSGQVGPGGSVVTSTPHRSTAEQPLGQRAEYLCRNRPRAEGLSREE